MAGKKKENINRGKKRKKIAVSKSVNGGKRWWRGNGGKRWVEMTGKDLWRVGWGKWRQKMGEMAVNERINGGKRTIENRRQMFCIFFA